jgi:anaerobic ribonucleoside-triphosphate reductase activating protein
MGEMLRLARAHFPVTALGPGVRLGIWVQGCTLACAGCISRDTWDPAAGVSVGIDELLDDVHQAIGEGAHGITVSGGEPMQQARALAAFLRGVREIGAASFDILLYTGYELSELDILQQETAALADVLITGRYAVTAPTRLIWRGSANQRMHLQTSLARSRYASYVDEEPDAPPIQVETDPEGNAWWVGVPNNPGTAKAIEDSLKALGYQVASVSWRRQAR